MVVHTGIGFVVGRECDTWAVSYRRPSLEKTRFRLENEIEVPFFQTIYKKFIDPSAKRPSNGDLNGNSNPVVGFSPLFSTKNFRA